jgi:putative lipoprotein
MVDLAGSAWRVLDLLGSPVLEDLELDITFDADGSAYGCATINRYRATWALDGDVLTFGPGISTRMAGPQPAMDQEDRWLSLLAEPLAVRADEPHLYLECSDGRTTLVRVTPP